MSSKKQKWIGVGVTVMLLSITVTFVYIHLQKQALEEAIVSFDQQQVEQILDRPFIEAEEQWMDLAYYYHNTASVISLYEAGLPLESEEWISMADTSSVDEFQKMIELGAPLDVKQNDRLLIEGLYGMNDDPEKWLITHEQLPYSYWVEHPQLLQIMVTEGNTNAFEDMIRRMKPEDIPYDEVVPLILRAYQPQMLTVLREKGYTLTTQDIAYAKELNVQIK
ncbi:MULTISPECIES: hypothetical protein [unclassified Exiguobacterium]|uniref:hypothetical protein n=1 Tax=unclassified Exiguobacterium TaxID=2644629 RepID=UPI0010403D1D|nr:MULTISPECIES: hypothetical protein [unclassified Exiguobacterium]TCI45918.1 hypothetical protein EVJ31_07090 [Exiguobacterium sp. SH5S32]TCI51675.1 hypothetical protein EVJ25_09340 [Exiguobacterium sp. SH1S4]TCI71661.1 hypothetical protein EVJ23_07085 [Exiguobacterium sp. SH1S1]